MLRTVTPAALLMLALTACDRDETRTFALEHLDPGTAMQMIEPYVPGGTSDIRITQRDSGATVSSITVTAPSGLTLTRIAR